MSIIGCTEWFENSTPASQEILVLNIYPLPSLNEPQPWLDRRPSSYVNTTRSGVNILELRRDVAGSLLPIMLEADVHVVVTKLCGIPLNIQYYVPGYWRKREVRIRQARILLSESMVLVKRSTILGPSPTSPKTMNMQENADLKWWVNSYEPQTNNNTVCITTRYGNFHVNIEGIFLKEIASRRLLRVWIF